MNEIELKNQFSNKVYFTKLVNQLSKDFALVGLSVDLNSCNNIEKLQAQLKEDLHFFSVNQPRALVQLFYSIDINENQLSELLNKKATDYYTKLSKTILLREAQKVILRIHYSS